MLISSRPSAAVSPLRQAPASKHAAPGAKARAVQLCLLLARQGEVQAQAIMQQLGITARMLRRDIKTIRAAGCPVAYVRKAAAYRLEGGRFLPPLDLTTQEALGLLVLTKHVHDDPVLAEATNEALAKIRSHLPAPLQQMIEPDAHHVSVRPVVGDSPGSDRDVYAAMDRAIRAGRQLLCCYQPVHSSQPPPRPPEEGGKFLFRPYHLMFSNRAWYVIGWHMDRQALRTLKLIRFASVQETATTFRKPKGFSISKYLGNCWRMVPGGQSYRVRLRIDAEFAGNTAETQWHSTQICDWLSDGQALLSFQVDGLEEIIWWILALGPHCQVLAPPELVEKVQTLAAQTAAQYQSVAAGPIGQKKIRNSVPGTPVNDQPVGRQLAASPGQVKSALRRAGARL